MRADPRGVVWHLMEAVKEGDRDLADFLAAEIIQHLERLDAIEEAPAPSPHGQDVEASLYEIAAKADPSHAWHFPTPDGVCRRCGYDATDPEAQEPCRGAALRSRQEREPVGRFNIYRDGIMVAANVAPGDEIIPGPVGYWLVPSASPVARREP